MLESEGFVDYWTFRLSELFRIGARGQDHDGAATFQEWLHLQIEQNRRFDEIAREILSASGDTHQYGPANFYTIGSDPRSQAEYFGQVFLGARIQCANCHDHPLDRWTQDDYHGLAALFARVERGREVRILPSGEVTHPGTGMPAVPRIPGERTLDVAPGEDGRLDLADWLTEPDNPYFARALVNRLWGEMMGRGLVEPVDDLRSTNPPTHPELLDWLAADFVASGHDIRHTLRLIATSATYGRTTVPTPENQDDDRFYSHMIERTLLPEVLADALTDVTGVPDRYGDQPQGTRAVELLGPQIESDALDILGRCSRDESCDGPSTAGGPLSLTATLHRLNGPFINRKITDPAGRLAILLEQGVASEDILEEYYLRALGRRSTDPERSFWARQFRDAPSPDEQADILQDAIWSLLNCREFTTNH